MSLETDLVAALTSTFGGRVFPDTAPFGAARPFLIYQQVGGSPLSSFCGATTPSNVRMQFHVWATTREESSTYMRTVESLVTAAPLRAVSLGGLIARFDEATKTHGAMQDFSFWA